MNKLQISQSIRVVHAALITHLESFKKSSSAFVEYHVWKDGLGIHKFCLSIKEDGFQEGSVAESNLGSLRLRSLGPKLTELVIEDSVWLRRDPPMLISEWATEDDFPFEEREARSKEFFVRLGLVHQRVRDYIIEALQEDRLLRTERKKGEKLSSSMGLEPNAPMQVCISYAHEDVESALRIYESLSAVEGINPWFD